MSDPNALDAATLAPYLEAHVAGFHGLQSIDKFTAGQSNPTYLITAASGRYVLRAKPPGQLLKSAHQVDREYRVMKALARTGVPVPPMLHLSDEDSPIGRMFFVMDFLEGRILWDPALPEVASNAERAAIYDAMNATLAALHDVDLEKTGLSDYGKPGNYFERQLGRWTSHLAPPLLSVATLEPPRPVGSGAAPLSVFSPPQVIATESPSLSPSGAMRAESPARHPAPRDGRRSRAPEGDRTEGLRAEDGVQEAKEACRRGDPFVATAIYRRMAAAARISTKAYCKDNRVYWDEKKQRFYID